MQGVLIRLLQVGLIFSLAAVTACNSKISAPASNRDFRSDEHRLVLYFDLRNDKQPVAGIVLNAQPSLEIEQRSVVLPFRSAKVQMNEDLYTTHGLYKDFTILNYILTPRVAGHHVVEIDPIFDLPPPEDQFANSQNLKGSVYFITKGLERRFVYRYQESVRSSPPAPKNVSLDSFDAIAVAIPDSAIGKEIQRGRTEAPAHISENQAARFYPASNAGVPALELRYELPPTSDQKLVLEYGMKLIAVILAPLVGLLLLGPGEVMAPRIRIIALIVGGVIELAILIIVLRVAFVSASDGQLKIGLDLGLVLAGTIFSGIVIWVKRKKKAEVR